MARAPKKKQEDEGVPAWLATYGDMITLVLTLFVLLYSFSSIDAIKWDRLVSSMSGTPFVAIQALDPNRVGPESRRKDEEDGMPEEQVDQVEKESEEETEGVAEPQPTIDPESNVDETKMKFDELFEKISTHIQQKGIDMKLNVVMQDEFIVLHITDSTLFNSGQAFIKQEAMIMLSEVSDIFEEYESIIKMIRIEGHTDDRRIHTEEFQSNWELSIGRAVTVLKYFLRTSDIANEKFSAVGYGEYHPIETNDTIEGRAQNRRVDFLIESVNKKD
ncbi:MAG: OmpA family protein [Clostridiales bacterium]|nr:OmpA family protein [Clostridiales bacterium]